MHAPDPLRALEFSRAKAQLSDVMNAVSREHQVCLVSRHGGKEWMALVHPDDVADVLRPYTFETAVAVDQDEVTVVVEPLRVLGFGSTLHEALEDALTEIEMRAETFFSDPAFHRKAGRGHEFPYLLRFALTPPEQRLSLLEAPSRPPTAAPTAAPTHVTTSPARSLVTA